MDERDQMVEEIIKALQPGAVNIAIKHLFADSIHGLLKMLLLMHKTPIQAEVIINDIIKKLGLKGERLKLYEHLTDSEKEKFDLSKPLDDANYKALLFSVSQDILKNSLGDKVKENEDDIF